MCLELKHKVLFHEIIHASSFEGGAKELTEEQVCTLENNLYTILKDNKFFR